MCIYCEWISVSNLPRNTRKVKYLDDYMMECHDGPDDRFVAPSWVDLTTNLVPTNPLVGAPASAPSGKAEEWMLRGALVPRAQAMADAFERRDDEESEEGFHNE